MTDRRWGWLGLACLVGMIVRAAYVTQAMDWPMNVLALAAGVALMLNRRPQ